MEITDWFREHCDVPRDEGLGAWASSQLSRQTGFLRVCCIPVFLLFGSKTPEGAA